jgi:hypothetical protein
MSITPAPSAACDPRHAVNGPAPDNNPSGSGHDARGRFTKGNPGGPGNPFNRTVADLRAALLACVTPQDVQEVMAALKEQAQKGNVAAIRLYLAYSVGKPAETVNPDHMDADEWQLRQQNLASPEQITHTFQHMPVKLANGIATAAAPCMIDDMVRRLDEVLKAPVALPMGDELSAPARGGTVAAPPSNGANGKHTPSGNGAKGGPAPSANGANGRSDGARAAAAPAPGDLRPPLAGRNPLQTVMARRQ